MTRYDIHMDSLRDNGEEISRIANNQMENDIKEIMRIASEIKWEGPTYDTFKNTFNKKMENVKYIPSVVNVYGSFMMKASGGYQDLSDNMYDEVMEDMAEHERKYGKREKPLIE